MGLSGLDRLQRPENLSWRVGERLRQALMSGAFGPGERITIRAVASALGVSLTPAREALAALVAEGVLELDANRSVCAPTLSREQLAELRTIRIALEGAAAESAALHIEPVEVERLEALQGRMVRLTDSRRYKAVMEVNREFHFLVYAAARMPTLLKLIEGCWLKTGGYINLLYPALGDAREGLDNHEAIVCAARGRDPIALRDAIEQDIRFATARLLEVLPAADAAEVDELVEESH